MIYIFKGNWACSLMSNQSFDDKERLFFFQQLGRMLDSGLPVLKALEMLEKRSAKKLRPISQELRLKLARGYSLAEAMKLQPQFFTPLAVNLVQAGEESGQLVELLEELAKFYQAQRSLKTSVFQAAAYPLLVIGIALLVLFFFVFYVLPILLNAYQNLGIKPQGALLVLVDIKNYVRPQTVSIILCSSLIMTIFSRKHFSLWSLHLPYIGKIYKLLLEIRCTKLLGLLLHSGLSINKSIELTRLCVTNVEYKRKLQWVQLQLAQGTNISDACLHSFNLFSPLSLELITLGVETGKLANNLLQSSEFCQQDLEIRLAKLRELLGPVLLVVGGCLVSLILIVCLGPLFDLVNNIPV